MATINISNKLPTIIIDAGHGGIDSGTSGADGTQEKDINLSIANHINKILITRGFTTIMLRTTDDLLGGGEEEISIHNRKVKDIRHRLSVIENYDNCIVISVHQNYFRQEQYRGFQVFYNTKNPQNEILAQQLQVSVTMQLQPENNRTIKTIGKEIYLLQHCTKTAVMVECGFMSNPQELLLLKNHQYQCKLAFLLANGIIDYVRGETIA